MAMEQAQCEGHEPGKFCRPAIGDAGTRVRVTYEIIYKELYGNGNLAFGLTIVRRQPGIRGCQYAPSCVRYECILISIALPGRVTLRPAPAISGLTVQRLPATFAVLRQILSRGL